MAVHISRTQLYKSTSNDTQDGDKTVAVGRKERERRRDGVFLTHRYRTTHPRLCSGIMARGVRGPSSERAS